MRVRLPPARARAARGRLFLYKVQLRGCALWSLVQCVHNVAKSKVLHTCVVCRVYGSFFPCEIYIC